MNIVEVRLFEMQIKGERLDEINAEETLNRLAAGRKRRAQIGKMLRRFAANWMPTFAENFGFGLPKLGEKDHVYRL